MDFKKVLGDIRKKAETRQVARKTKKNSDAYRNSPNLRLSRLYGYRLSEDDSNQIVEEEAEVIRAVMIAFSLGRTADEIKEELDRKDIRTRSRNKWTKFQIENLIRPIYTGYILARGGKRLRSNVYSPIVPWTTYEAAKRELDRQRKEKKK